MSMFNSNYQPDYAVSVNINYNLYKAYIYWVFYEEIRVLECEIKELPNLLPEHLKVELELLFKGET